MRALLLIIFTVNIFFSGLASHPVKSDEVVMVSSRHLYEQLENKTLAFEPFDMAYTAYVKLKDSIQLKEGIISVVDFTQPSTNKRFYLINVEKGEVLYQDYVAHGKNSGLLEARKFSNIINSNQSSLGFYRTAETYHGKHGLSLKIDGLEKGINHLARKRHIVIHAAQYAEESFIRKHGRLGRSFGCPALPSKDYHKIIELIKNGTLFFIYYPEKKYLEQSNLSS